MNTRVWRSSIDVVASLSMIVAATVIIGKHYPTSHAQSVEYLPREPITIAGAAMAGNESAKVVLTEFADFQCPFCAKFAVETWPLVLAEYVRTGRLRVAFRHLPLSRHPFARKAAAAAECANRQGKFLEMHDVLFTTRRLTDEDISAHAKALSLNVSQFERCVEADSATAVANDLDQARALHISSTPTFLLGTKMPDGRVKVIQRLSGAIDFTTLRKQVDMALTAAR